MPNPFFGLVKLGALAQPTVAYGQLLRPYPQYNGIRMQSPPNRNSIYHSAQVKVEKRFAKGGTVLGSYTWAKLISDTDTLTGWLEPGGGAGGVQNNYNIRLERSLALYDTPHRAGDQLHLDLPFGKGQHFASGVTGCCRQDRSPDGASTASTTFQSGNPAADQHGREHHQLVRRRASGPNRTGSQRQAGGLGAGPAHQVVRHRRRSRCPAAFTFGNSGPHAAGCPFARHRELRLHGVQEHADH